ncbi:MAG: ABC transporter substrate-binding protein [Pseudomonadota bacterium]
MRTAIVLCASIACLLLPGTPALAADSPADVLKNANKLIEKQMDKKVEEGGDAEKKRDEKIKKIVDDFLDFNAIAKKALGKYWAERTDEEKDEFNKLFKELMQKNYLKTIKEKKDYVIAYDSEVIDEDDKDKAVVTTTVTAKSQEGEEAETTMVYKLHKVKKKWLVYDIETDEVSLVSNYKSSFGKIIKEKGYAELVTKIRKKIDAGSDGSTI